MRLRKHGNAVYIITLLMYPVAESDDDDSDEPVSHAESAWGYLPVAGEPCRAGGTYRLLVSHAGLGVLTGCW